MRLLRRPLLLVASASASGSANVAPIRAALACAVLVFVPLAPLASAQGAVPLTAQCNKPLYLTFDTGHMEVAPLVAEVLARHQV